VLLTFPATKACCTLGVRGLVGTLMQAPGASRRARDDGGFAAQSTPAAHTRCPHPLRKKAASP